MRWKKNTVISLKLKNNKFALIQLLEKEGEVVIFNIFRDQDFVDDLNLKNIPILFITVIDKAVLKRSFITIHKKVVPILGLKVPFEGLIGEAGFRKVKFWENTSDEIEVLINNTGKMFFTKIDYEKKTAEYTSIENEDYIKYKHLELKALSTYPSFNERLYLCSELGFNVSPEKEIAFNRSIVNPIFKTYIKIISGIVSLEELGY